MLSVAEKAVIGTVVVVAVEGIVKDVIVGGVISKVIITVELALVEIFPAGSLDQA